MASETQTVSRIGTENVWRNAVVAGLVAGAVMGVMLTMMMTSVIAAAIPALYGASGMVVGWIAHLFHSVVFALIFAAVVSRPSLERYADRLSTGTALGIGYGVIVWIVAAAIVMPIWLQAVGFPMAPSLPNFNPTSLVGHVVYGALLGGVYATLSSR